MKIVIVKVLKTEAYNKNNTNNNNNNNIYNSSNSNNNNNNSKYIWLNKNHFNNKWWVVMNSFRKIYPNRLIKYNNNNKNSLRDHKEVRTQDFKKWTLFNRDLVLLWVKYPKICQKIQVWFLNSNQDKKFNNKIINNSNNNNKLIVNNSTYWFNRNRFNNSRKNKKMITTLLKKVLNSQIKL